MQLQLIEDMILDKRMWRTWIGVVGKSVLSCCSFIFVSHTIASVVSCSSIYVIIDCLYLDYHIILLQFLFCYYLSLFCYYLLIFVLPSLFLEYSFLS